jgi:hypothetical protein
MIKRKFLFIDGTYVIDHITKICKIDYYEGKMKRIHYLHGKSRTTVKKTKEQMKLKYTVCFLQRSISTNSADTLQVIYFYRNNS